MNKKSSVADFEKGDIVTLCGYILNSSAFHFPGLSSACQWNMVPCMVKPGYFIHLNLIYCIWQHKCTAITYVNLFTGNILNLYKYKNQASINYTLWNMKTSFIWRPLYMKTCFKYTPIHTYVHIYICTTHYEQAGSGVDSVLSFLFSYVSLGNSLINSWQPHPGADAHA